MIVPQTAADPRPINVIFSRHRSGCSARRAGADVEPQHAVGHRIEAALVPPKDVTVICANVSRFGLTAAIILPLGHGLMAEPWGARAPGAILAFLSVGAGDNKGGLQHVRLQLAQR
jgi:hypothetical protein